MSCSLRAHSLTPSYAFAPINISIQITGDRRVPGSDP
jgi:hypothetical protein